MDVVGMSHAGVRFDRDNGDCARHPFIGRAAGECLRLASYGIVLLAMLEIALSRPLLSYAVTPKYQAPLVRLLSV